MTPYALRGQLTTDETDGLYVIRSKEEIGESAKGTCEIQEK